MEQDLTERLRDVKLCQGIIREREIERMFQDFENRLKRNCNLAQDRLDGYEYLDLPGLKADPERGFKTGAVAIPRSLQPPPPKPPAGDLTQPLTCTS